MQSSSFTYDLVERAATAHLDDDFRIHRALSDSVNVADDNGILHQVHLVIKLLESERDKRRKNP
ncbi:hypothetical protein NC651_019800 [Populus alba x Populus x berolinensis]|nr:hypothetical protein NC651_019800 [Populus alba x Populus x berolinensis]